MASIQIVERNATGRVARLELLNIKFKKRSLRLSNCRNQSKSCTVPEVGQVDYLQILPYTELQYPPSARQRSEMDVYQFTQTLEIFMDST